MDVTKLRNDIIASFKESIGEAWKDLSTADKKILEECAKDAAKLHFKSLTDKSPELDIEIKIVNASLSNLTVANRFNIKKVFWQSVQRAATLALSFLMKAALASLAV